jgi:hypothetical protein
MTRREIVSYILLMIGLALAGYASRPKGPRLTRKGLETAARETPQERRERSK